MDFVDFDVAKVQRLTRVTLAKAQCVCDENGEPWDQVRHPAADARSGPLPARAARNTCISFIVARRGPSPPADLVRHASGPHLLVEAGARHPRRAALRGDPGHGVVRARGVRAAGSERPAPQRGKPTARRTVTALCARPRRRSWGLLVMVPTIAYTQSVLDVDWSPADADKDDGVSFGWGKLAQEGAFPAFGTFLVSDPRGWSTVAPFGILLPASVVLARHPSRLGPIAARRPRLAPPSHPAARLGADLQRDPLRHGAVGMTRRGGSWPRESRA